MIFIYNFITCIIDHPQSLRFMGEGFWGVWFSGSEACHQLCSWTSWDTKKIHHFFESEEVKFVKLTPPKKITWQMENPPFLLGDTSSKSSESFVCFPGCGYLSNRGIRNPLTKKQVTIQVVTGLSVSFADCQLVAVGKLQLRVGLDTTSDIFEWVRKYKVGVYTHAHTPISLYIYIYTQTYPVYIHIYIHIYTYYIFRCF